MLKNIIPVIVLISSVLMPLVAASEQDEPDNVQIHEVSVEKVPCNPNEDTLGCAYRVMLEKRILEHPRPISEIRRGLNMPMILYFN